MTEKDLMRVLFSSISCILVCMVCLASTTWALFSVTVTSDNNAIQLGQFATNVELMTQRREVILPVEDGYLLNEGTYVLNVTNTGNCRGYTEILVTDGMDKAAMEELTKLGYEVVKQFYEPDELGKALCEFDAVVVRSKTKIRANHIDEVVNNNGKLKLAIRGGVGVDNIDVKYAEDKGS